MAWLGSARCAPVMSATPNDENVRLDPVEGLTTNGVSR